MALRAAAVNVDVDSLVHYHRIHGLDPARATEAAWERGVPRFLDLFRDLGVKATFFVIAEDVVRSPAARSVCGELAALGHEVASHSFSHPYDLTRLPDAALHAELDRAREILSEVRGREVTGFRAPGYTLTDRLVDVLRQRGYAYDSSLFPCPPYYLAKAAVMGWMRLTGRRSASILDRPSILWAERSPHLRRGLLEVPVTVLPALRLPYIGTSLLAGGRAFEAISGPLLRRLDLVNLECHALDLLDLEADGLDPALRVEPVLRVPLERRTETLRRALTALRDGWGVSTLEDLAPRLRESFG